NRPDGNSDSVLSERMSSNPSSGWVSAGGATAQAPRRSPVSATVCRNVGGNTVGRLLQPLVHPLRLHGPLLFQQFPAQPGERRYGHQRQSEENDQQIPRRLEPESHE